jgi:uncharacterized protein (TIGR02246 family)
MSRNAMSSVDEEIENIRQPATRWTAAIEAGNLEQLAQLMTDDIVVIHGNGRVVSGKKAVMDDFAQSVRSFVVQQTVDSEETVIAGEWAFDRANVHTAMCSREGGDTNHFDSRTVTILRKKSLGWCVARAIGVVDQQRMNRKLPNPA